MKKLTKAEWIAITIAFIIVVGTFVWYVPLPFFPQFDTSAVQGGAAGTSGSELSEDSLITQDVERGEGAFAQNGAVLTVHYTGALESGQIFDSSRARGQPFVFVLGQGDVIEGWDHGLIGMREGGVRVLVIPPELGYGAAAVGPIPPNSTLVFEVELIDVQ